MLRQLRPATTSKPLLHLEFASPTTIRLPRAGASLLGICWRPLADVRGFAWWSFERSDPYDEIPTQSTTSSPG